jgi:hypothetical protein
LECVDDASVQIELCDARDARVVGNAVIAAVDQRFDLYFRLQGMTDQRVRVRLKHATGAVSVEPLEIAARFDVDKPPGSVPPAAAKKKPASKDEAWLVELPEGGVRDVFRHIAVHGSISEAEATQLLGGARHFRAFSRQLDEHAALAPFRVRIDMSSGIKCYVRGER